MGRGEDFDRFYWYQTFTLGSYVVNPSLAEHDMPCLANSVDPDKLASEEAKWSGSALFAIKYVNLYNKLDQVIWLAEK